MEAQEYLASFGKSGEFGRFRTVSPLYLHRGERVVVRGSRGVEIAEVLRQATPRHAHFLPNTSVGQLLRRLTPADEQSESELRLRAHQLFERAGQLATEMGLPLLLVDVELLLDGEHAVLHQLRWEDADVRPFVSTLSREFSMHVLLVDLSRDLNGAAPEGSNEAAGCGRPHCGQKADGGCSSCGTGGCGSCGSAAPNDVELYFAQLREQMERQRTALL
ncbi:MAG TPA: PSP1 C-terminal domain-containing protein [Gemmataceae bacterium]|nr:PSP1 C-terminal domain-containing protein [Gemmataceae bacterium]